MLSRYVWLVPQYTQTVDAAATGFEIVIQGDANPALEDLAKGAGGDYRYILTQKNVGSKHKVTDSALLRSDSAVEGTPAGWNGMTIDINKGRGKTYLYVLWKTTSAA